MILHLLDVADIEISGDTDFYTKDLGDEIIESVT